VEVTLHHGRAFVSIDEDPQGFGSPPNPGFFIVDMRPLLDDDATTTTPILQGSLPVSRPRVSQVVGNTLYLNSMNAFQVWDVSAAMDEDPLTTVTAVTPISSLPISHAMSMAAYGSMVFMATQVGGVLTGQYLSGTYAIDVSTPATPTVVGFSNVEPNYFGCGLYNTVHHSSLSVHGSRLYLSMHESSWVFELE